jgi:hypothetical protein
MKVHKEEGEKREERINVHKRKREEIDEVHERRTEQRRNNERS